MTPSLAWGIIGAGRIARKFIAAQPAGAVRAIASRELPRAAGMAHELGVAHAHGSYDALLADAAVQAVYIALPNALHAEWSIAAARAGKHVLCEKPFAPTLAEAEAMFAAAREHGVWMMEAFMYRFHPQTVALQRLLDERAIGRVRTIAINFGIYLDRPEDARWSAELAGGCAMDLGCYCVSLARMAAGEAPSSVTALAQYAASGVDETIGAVLEYPSGIVAHIGCSYRTSYNQAVTIAGDDGAIAIARPFTLPPDSETTLTLMRGRHFAPEETLRYGPANVFRLEADGLAALVTSGHGAHGLPEMPLAETLENTATLEAILLSARERRTVALAV